MLRKINTSCIIGKNFFAAISLFLSAIGMGLFVAGLAEHNNILLLSSIPFLIISVFIFFYYYFALRWLYNNPIDINEHIEIV